MGRIEDILKGFNFAPSFIEIIFFDNFLTVIGPSHFIVRSLYTITKSSGSIKYLVASGCFVCSAICSLASAAMVSFCFLACLRASNLWVRFASMLYVHGSLGDVSNTSSHSTSSLGSKVSLNAFIDILWTILSACLLYSDFVTSNILLSK